MRGNYAVLITGLLIICCLGQFSEARGRAGGSRGGSSYRSSSYRSSSYRSSSYRSSGYSGAGASRTVPSARYARVYRGYTGYYAYYYGMYFAYARSSVYMNRRAPCGEVEVCANYEANENGTTLGVFTCPFDFEPDEFTACCGDSYAEYCCKKGLSGHYSAIGCCLNAKQKSNSGRVGHTSNVSTTNVPMQQHQPRLPLPPRRNYTSSGSNPPPPYAYAMTGYSNGATEPLPPPYVLQPLQPYDQSKAFPENQPVRPTPQVAR
ncbi:hypothetical protein CAPTEDRAFT_214399 [Capitella teleta]|uniref:Uncharacterized protein n=1 Tax=Capitella teleta TaxID=283909 RepID=R7TMN3_CAPTE|nr:hypothetical protein CAPTEDRAFT_214399 [Capitella teleta]|eukprot:ELT92796.1 hypothetical protein CAPTEDRAFT_214399 [Capitella teleta]